VDETAVATTTIWGVPLVLGLSESTTYKPVLYNTLTAVFADHCRYTNGTLLGISPVARAAQGLFNQGVSQMYVMAIPCATDRKPTAVNIASALATIQPLALQGNFDSIVFAGVYVNDALASEYVGLANTCNLIFSMTNAPGQTAADIVTSVATNVNSKNGYVLAHNDAELTTTLDFSTNGQIIGTGNGTTVVFSTPNFPISGDPVITVGGTAQTVTTDYTLDKATGVITFESGSVPGTGKAIVCKYKAVIPADDVAAVALGAICCSKPWNSVIWRTVSTSVGTYFSANDLATLEAANVNAIITANNTSCLSNSLTSNGSPKFIDIVRTENYAKAILRSSLLTLRLNSSKIPFTTAGISTVRVAIRDAMERLLREGSISTYTITMPTVDSITVADRGNRILRGISVAAQLAGDVHTFEMDLVVSV